MPILDGVRPLSLYGVSPSRNLQRAPTCYAHINLKAICSWSVFSCNMRRVRAQVGSGTRWLDEVLCALASTATCARGGNACKGAKNQCGAGSVSPSGSLVKVQEL